jgi:predicted negative regulator of RcsB-dependent stress response
VSDYLTDDEQLERLRGWWAANGRLLVVAVVLAVAGVVGWNVYKEQRSDQIARASELYADYLEAEGTERETIETTFAREFPDSTYRAFVLLRQAAERMEEDDAAAAEALLLDALEPADGGELRDLVRLRLARVLQALDRSDEALALLGDVTSIGFRSRVQELKGDILLDQGQRAAAHEAYAAALEEAGDAAQRPILEMKVADTADTNDS